MAGGAIWTRNHMLGGLRWMVVYKWVAVRSSPSLEAWCLLGPIPPSWAFGFLCFQPLVGRFYLLKAGKVDSPNAAPEGPG